MALRFTARPIRLDRQIQFLRAAVIDDGFNSSIGWGDANEHGLPLWASMQDVSDMERMRAREVSATITTRFVVRYSAFTADITPKDRLICDGDIYDISGIKEGEGRRQYLEFTCAARSDKGEPDVVTPPPPPPPVAETSFSNAFSGAFS